MQFIKKEIYLAHGFGGWAVQAHGWHLARAFILDGRRATEGEGKMNRGWGLTMNLHQEPTVEVTVPTCDNSLNPSMRALLRESLLTVPTS